MCGIVAYLGNSPSIPAVIDGLQRLEYRGYDSSGVAYFNNGELVVHKASGKLERLQNLITEMDMPLSQIAIGHTRWATHGAANDINAHPHLSSRGEVSIVHNGIIENFSTLKTELQESGYSFQSDTDSEVIAHLLEQKSQETPDFLTAIRITLPRLKGAYALTMLSKREPDALFAARHNVPLAIGIRRNKNGRYSYMIASDTLALAGYADWIVHMRDGYIARLSPDNLLLIDCTGTIIEPNIERFDLTYSATGKNGYEHYMLREIHEQPAVIRSLLDDPIDDALNLIKNSRRIIITGCGTSLNAGLIGKYLIEDLIKIPVIVESAGELRYRNPCFQADDLMIALSQSGETADTLAAVELARRQEIKVLSLVNRPDSGIARASDLCLPLRAGPELSVAATKSFTAQVTLLTRMALHLGRQEALMAELKTLPHIIETLLAQTSHYTDLALAYADTTSLIFMARGINYAVALEAALKLKEISYIHAEGYSASELKHGPLALLSPTLPVIALLADSNVFDKTMSNCLEAAARGAPVIAITNRLLPVELASHFVQVITVPAISEKLSPLVLNIATQLIAYHVARHLGRDIDQPRNLAKSVTVE